MAFLGVLDRRRPQVNRFRFPNRQDCKRSVSMRAADGCGRQNGSDGGRSKSQSQLDGASFAHGSIPLRSRSPSPSTITPDQTKLRMSFGSLSFGSRELEEIRIGNYSDQAPTAPIFGPTSRALSTVGRSMRRDPPCASRSRLVEHLQNSNHISQLF